MTRQVEVTFLPPSPLGGPITTSIINVEDPNVTEITDEQALTAARKYAVRFGDAFHVRIARPPMAYVDLNGKVWG